MQKFGSEEICEICVEMKPNVLGNFLIDGNYGSFWELNVKKQTTEIICCDLIYAFFAENVSLQKFRLRKFSLLTFCRSECSGVWCSVV